MPFDGKPCSRCKKPMKNRSRYQEVCEDCKAKAKRKRKRRKNDKRTNRRRS